MALSVMTSQDGKIVEMRVSESFRFSLNREFRDAHSGSTQTGCTYKVNLSATEYMDSSALGMILLLKEHADAHQSEVRIIAPSPAIRRILEIASFDKIFRFEG